MQVPEPQECVNASLGCREKILDLILYLYLNLIILKLKFFIMTYTHTCILIYKSTCIYFRCMSAQKNLIKVIKKALEIIGM